MAPSAQAQAPPPSRKSQFWRQQAVESLTASDWPLARLRVFQRWVREGVRERRPRRAEQQRQRGCEPCGLHLRPPPCTTSPPCRRRLCAVWQAARRSPPGGRHALRNGGLRGRCLPPCQPGLGSCLPRARAGCGARRQLPRCSTRRAGPAACAPEGGACVGRGGAIAASDRVRARPGRWRRAAV